MIDQKTYNKYVMILIGFVALYMFNPHVRHKEDELAATNLIYEEASRAPQSIVAGLTQAGTAVSPAQALQIAVNDAMSADPQNRPPVLSSPYLGMHKFKNGNQELSWRVILESSTYYVSAQEGSRYERVDNILKGNTEE